MMKRFSLNTALLILSACGPQAFVPGTISQNQTGGTMTLPPKIDVLVGYDNKGAMASIYPGFATEIANFADQLEAQGWNYRLTAISLADEEPGLTYPLTQVATSKYDGNWDQFGLWLSPYPGSTPGSPGISILSSLFSAGATTQSFFPASLVGNPSNGRKPGIKNEVDFLTRADVSSQFIRSDAMLAVITLSPSRDTSGGDWEFREMDGQWIWNPPTPDNLTTYANALITLKGSPQLVKYFSLVSQFTRTNNSCRGSNSVSGQRYIQFAQILGGSSLDICTNTLPTALNFVAQDLQGEILDLRRVYVVLGNEPNPGTIVVKKNGLVQPENAVDGWQYIGFSTQFTVDLPVPMNQATGYMIQLNGTARATGNESITVDFQNAGAGPDSG